MSDAPDPLDQRLAARLSALRAERGLSLDDLAERSGISRATLSRLERGETSPTAAMLGRLCAVHGWTMSRLMAAAEAEPPTRLRPAGQPLWIDPDTGFRRRSLSPLAPGCRVELMEGLLPEGAVIDYPASPVAGFEHHLWMWEEGGGGGVLEIELEGTAHRLEPGDSLRWRLTGASRYRSLGPGPARYILATCLP